MKNLILILLFSGTMYSQDTIRSAKSVNTSTHTVNGYVVQSVIGKDTIYQRVDSFKDLPKGIKVNRKDPIKSYPKRLLKKREAYMNHLRRN